jgi:hypothetical protein
LDAGLDAWIRLGAEQPGGSTILNNGRFLSQFPVKVGSSFGLRRNSVKSIVLMMAAWLFCAGAARAQNPDEQPINPEMQRQELINLEKENARAIQLHNSTFFKSVYSEDFTGVSRYGEVVNKAGMIRDVGTNPLEFISVVSSDPQIKMFRDAAYVLSMRSEVGHANGKKFYNQFRVLRVYVNTPRGWRIVSQLETKLIAGEDR